MFAAPAAEPRAGKKRTASHAVVVTAASGQTSKVSSRKSSALMVHRNKSPLSSLKGRSNEVSAKNGTSSIKNRTVSNSPIACS